MSLPESLGSPEADAKKLLNETMGIADPFGVPTLVIHPEDFAKDDADTARKKLAGIVDEFFSRVSDGDADKKRKLSEMFAEKRFRYIPDSAIYSAGHEEYADAHNASLGDRDGPLCSIVVAPRMNVSFAKSAQNLTGVAAEKLAALPVSPEQGKLITYWHEFAHGTGANEPQADKMSAIVYRKSFRDTEQLKIQADMRALDAVFSHDVYMDPNKKFARCKIYGWPTVDAIDSVVAMSDEEISRMDESAIRAVNTEKFDKKVRALHKVGNELYKRIPNAMVDRNLPVIAATVRDLLEKGKFGDGDDDRNKIATRFLLAAERTDSRQPAPVLTQPVRTNGTPAPAMA